MDQKAKKSTDADQQSVVRGDLEFDRRELKVYRLCERRCSAGFFQEPLAAGLEHYACEDQQRIDRQRSLDHFRRCDHHHKPHRADHLAARPGELQTEADHRQQLKPIDADHDESTARLPADGVGAGQDLQLVVQHRRVHERNETNAAQTLRIARQSAVSRVDALSNRPDPAATSSALHLQRLRSVRGRKASGRPAKHPVHGAPHKHRSARAVLRDRQEQKQHRLVDG